MALLPDPLLLHNRRMDSSPLTSEIPAAEYKLFVRNGVRRFYLRNTNEGIYLSPKGVGWFIDGTSYTRDWHEIAAVNPVVAHIPKNGPIGTCRISFTDGAVLSVLSASKWGHSDDDRNVEYGRFLQDFHRVIPVERRNAIRFETGFGKGHHIAMTVVLIVAGLFFVALPLGLAIYFRELQALLITAAGAAFVYPVFRSVEAGYPASYDPDQVPPDLFP
jgi:hypothetical protein